MPTDAAVAAAGSLWSALADPWSQEIVRRGMLEVALIGAVAGPLGCWIVLYGLSYGAESLAHGLFPGLVLAALTGIPLAVGGAAGLAVAAAAIALAARVPGISRDTAVAIAITTLFGAGALLALSPSSPPGIQTLLFGDVLGVSDTDLALSAVAAVAVLGGMRVLHAPLLAAGFDRGGAGALGVSPALVDAGLLLLLAVAILVTVQSLGNLLALAVIVGPGASAALVTRRVGPMLRLAAALAVACGIGGLYASYYLDTAAGASIAGATVLAYMACLAAGAARGRGHARTA